MTEKVKTRRGISIASLFALLAVVIVLILTGLYSQLSSGKSLAENNLSIKDKESYLYGVEEAFKNAPKSSGKYLSALFALKQNDYEKAGELLKDLSFYPQANISLKKEAMLSMVISGRYNEAFMLAKILINSEQDSEFTFNLANITLLAKYIKQKEYDVASNLANILINQNPSNKAFKILLSWIKFAQKDYKGAREEFSFIEKDSVLDNITGLHKGLIFTFTGDYAQADKIFKNALKNNTLYDRVLIETIVAFYRSHNKPEEATIVANLFKTDNAPTSIYILNKDYKKYPIDNTQKGVADLIYRLAKTSVNVESVSTVSTLLRLSIYLNTDHDEAKMLLGKILMKDKQTDQAIKALRLLSKKSSYYYSAQKSLAELLNDKGEKSQSVKILKDIISNSEEELLIINSKIELADLKRGEKKYDEASIIYTEILDILSKKDLEQNIKWVILYSRGICYERTKRWKLAEQDFLNALKIKPEQPDILNYLGYSWLEQGTNLIRAKKMLSLAHRKRPNDVHILDSLGWAYYKLGNYEVAVSLLERAVSKMPYDVTLNDHLGDAYLKTNKYLQAKYQWQRVLDSKNLDQGIRLKVEQKLKELEVKLK